MDRGWVLHAVSVALVLGVLPVHLGVVTAFWSRLQLRRGGRYYLLLSRAGGKTHVSTGFVAAECVSVGHLTFDLVSF